MFRIPRTVETLLAAGGIVAGIVAFGGHQAASAAPATPERIETLTVVPELSVPYVLACQAETGPADGAFRWVTCVPDESPDGGPISYIGEDGSASYGDGWSIAAAVQPAAGTVAGKWTAPAAPTATAPLRTVAQTSPPRPPAGSCSEPLPTPPVGTPAPAPTPQPRPLVNVNTASVAQLDALPGIGDVLAARIVQLRPYSSVDDLHRVARIPFAKVAPLVTV